MAWQRNYVVLTTGKRIRYTLFQRTDSPVYLVRFKSPHSPGRPERSTGRRKKPEAMEEAHRIILEEYGEVTAVSERCSWDEAVSKLKETMQADGKRPRTISEYVKSLNRLPK